MEYIQGNAILLDMVRVANERTRVADWHGFVTLTENVVKFELFFF